MVFCLDIFDVTDPTKPQWLSISRIDGRYYFPDNDYWNVAVAQFQSRYYAYFLNTYNGVYIFDVTNPKAPVRLGRVTVASDRISEQIFPTRACIFPYDQSIRRQSPTAAIACGEGVLYIASSMTDLHICAGTDLDKFLHPILERPHTVPIASPEGDFYDFDPKQYGLSDFARYAPDGQVYSVAVYKGNIYTACGKGGVAVLDVDLQVLAVLPTKDITMDVQVHSGILYCAESAGGLAAYTLSEDGLHTTERWRYNSNHGVVRQVRLSSHGRWAVIQCGSCFVPPMWPPAILAAM